MSLFRTAARVGVATSVHGRVRQRQQSKWGDSTPPPAQQFVPAPTVGPTPDKLDSLRQLGELRAAGVLTEQEFAEQKARILS